MQTIKAKQYIHSQNNAHFFDIKFQIMVTWLRTLYIY